MSPRLRHPLAALLATLVGVGAYFVVRTNRAPPAPTLPPPQLDVVRIDDELQVTPGKETLPAWLTAEVETVDGKSHTYFRVALPPGGTYTDARAIGDAWVKANLKLPDDDAVVWGVPDGPDAPIRSYFLRGEAIVSSADVQGAKAWADETGQPFVSIQLSADGAARLKAATHAWIEKRLAVLLDGVVVTAPVVKTEIPNGNVSLAMGRGATLGAAQKLAEALKPR
jgi:hypothetical protein